VPGHQLHHLSPAKSDREVGGVPGEAGEGVRIALSQDTIRATYGERTVEERLAGLRLSAGSWQGGDLTGVAYVDAIRGDLGDRLRRLGLR